MLISERTLKGEALSDQGRTGPQRKPRLWLRLLTAALMMVASTGVAVMATPGPAQAVVYSGSRDLYIGSHHSYTSWRGSDSFYDIRSYPWYLSGKCQDTILDWKRPGGHFDARVVRSCVDLYVYSAQGYEAWILNGMQKNGICVGPSDATNISPGTCVNASGADQTVASVNTDFPNTCARDWIRGFGQVFFYGDGGWSDMCGS